MTYLCQICNTRWSSVKKYNTHQYLHRNLKNCRFICIYDSCGQEYSKYANFRMHVIRSHTSARDIITQSKPLKCTVKICTFQTKDKIKFHSHLYQHILNGTHIDCPYSCGQQNFSTKARLKSHIYRKHNNINSDVSEAACTGGASAFLVDTPSEIVNLFEPAPANSNRNDENQNDTFSNSNVIEAYRETLALTYLSLRTKYFLTESALQAIIQGISDSIFIGNRRIEYLLQRENIVLPRNFLNENNLFLLSHNKPSGIFRNAYSRRLYYMQKYKYISPLRLCIGKTISYFLFLLCADNENVK